MPSKILQQKNYPLNFHQLQAHSIFEASAKMEQGVGEVSSQKKSLLLAIKLHQSCTGSGGISWISQGQGLMRM